MDAVKFLQERKRMCASQTCSVCPVYATGRGCIGEDDPELLVATVEEWYAKHPRKTRQNVFLKQYPNAALDSYGVLEVSPCDIEATLYDYKDCNADDCEGCRREFWLQEVE